LYKFSYYPPAAYRTKKAAADNEENSGGNKEIYGGDPVNFRTTTKEL
jgi:hypothetical protein